MSDIYSRKKRSQIMSKISGKETEPEILVRKLLFARGYRFRKNDKRYPGKPDIVLPKYRVIIFIHGCFWHGHNCPAGKLPETNVKFWKQKIQSNIDRDKKNKANLKKAGWKVIEIWQCRIRNKKLFDKTMEKVISSIG